MSATITFDVCSEFPVDRVSRRRAVSAPDGSLVRQQRTVNERELFLFRLTWNEATRAMVERIEYLWEQAGPVHPMNFTPPGEPMVEVQFANDTQNTVRRNAVLGRATVELVQVR